jgi:hypothetical protein
VGGGDPKRNGVIKYHMLGFSTLVACLAYLPPWRWRQYVSPKFRWTSVGIHGLTTQKTVPFKYRLCCKMLASVMEKQKKCTNRFTKSKPIRHTAIHLDGRGSRKRHVYAVCLFCVRMSDFFYLWDRGFYFNLLPSNCIFLTCHFREWESCDISGCTRYYYLISCSAFGVFHRYLYNRLYWDCASRCFAFSCLRVSCSESSCLMKYTGTL